MVRKRYFIQDGDQTTRSEYDFQDGYHELVRRISTRATHRRHESERSLPLPTERTIASHED